MSATRPALGRAPKCALSRLSRTAAIAACLLPAPVVAKAGDAWIAGETWVGRDVVPPDVIDSTVNQDRIFTDLGTQASINYDTGPVILRGLGGVQVFPAESDYNRYRLGAEAQVDIPLAAKGRTRLRLIPGFDYVFANDGRVFDRVRLDGQLIHRHNPEHVSTLRLRYGYRNQTERRFTGYDQSEWMGELRHVWRPGNARTRIQASLLGLHNNAEDNRFTYDGYGTQIIARTPLAQRLTGYGRLYLVHRDYKDDFSRVFPYPRKDTQFRLTGGLEYALDKRFSLYGEAGYTSNDSNVPTRDYKGFVGRMGIRWNIGLTD